MKVELAIVSMVGAFVWILALVGIFSVASGNLVITEIELSETSIQRGPTADR